MVQKSVEDVADSTFGRCICFHMSSDCIHDPSLISRHISNVCMSVVQAGFLLRFWAAIDLFWKMSESNFELVEGLEDRYFRVDTLSLPDSADSGGTHQHYVESFVYEHEEEVKTPGLGSNQEMTGSEVTSAQLPVAPSRPQPGYFVITSGTCLHTAVCHYGKRAEVKTLPVEICTMCLSNDIKRLPHTSEVYLDWNDTIHQSRVCEEFLRRRSYLSEIAVKRIVKKCRQCF